MPSDTTIYGSRGLTPEQAANEAAAQAARFGRVAPVVAPEPTVADVYKEARLSAGDTAYDAAAADFGAGLYRDASQPINEQDIYRSRLDLYQKEIDAVNDIFREEMAKAKVQGEGRVGSQRAIAARSGILGSDFAGAQKEKVLDYNTGIERAISAERDAKIASIMGLARQGAAEEIAAKRLAKQQGAEAYLNFLGSQSERRSARLESIAAQFLAQGVSPEEVDPKRLQEFATTAGVSVDDILTSYAVARSAQATEPDGFTLSEGQARFVFNPETGQYKEVAARQKTYAPKGGTSTGGANGLVDTAGNPIKLTASQVDTLSGFDNTIQAAASALEILDRGVQTGPIAGRVHAAKKLADTADPNTLQLEQTIGKIKADYMKAISGAAVSDAEVVRLSRFLPDLNDQEGVIRSKLATLNTELARAKQNFLSTLGAAGSSTLAPTDTPLDEYDAYLKSIGQ